MIAGVKGSAVLSALLILLPWDARAADDMAGAVRELARKTVALAGRGEPVSVSWRNLSSLPSGDFNQARIAFEAALREAGGRVSEIAPSWSDVRLTLSGNPSQFLLVEEARKGEDRQVWIASWKRPAAAGPPAGSALTLEKKLVWEQEEPILDVAMLGPGILVLSPSRVSLATGRRRPNPCRSRRRGPGRATCADICGSMAAASRRTCPAWPAAARSSRRSPWSVTRATSPGPWMRARAACFWPTSPPGAITSMDGCPRPTASARRWHPSSPPRPRKRTGAPTGCWPCSTAARRFSTPRSSRWAASLVGQRPGGDRSALRRRLADSGDQGRRGTRARCHTRLRAGQPDARPALRPAGTAGTGHGVLESGRQRGARGGQRPRHRPLPGIRDYGELRWIGGPERVRLRWDGQ